MEKSSQNQPRTIDQTEAAKAWELIESAQKILIISHRSPDPDSIGSNLALRQALIRMCKTVVSGCVDPAPVTCRFHPLSQTLTKELNLPDFDLIVSVDCGSVDQVALGRIYPDLFSIKPFINIDHHVSNNLFGKINLVYTNFCSTCEIAYHLFRFWKIPLNADIATLLLMGLYYDTGSFKHSNVTPEVLEMADDLLAHGANLELIISNLFRRFNEDKFHLWGDVLENFHVSEENAAAAAGDSRRAANIAAAAISQTTFQKHRTKSEDLSGLIDYLSAAAGTDFAVMAHEDDKGNIKGSLRTNHDLVDLSQLAARLGGGGHKKASGFGFPGQILPQEIWKITPSP